MSVIRVQKSKNFTVMSNTHLFDKNLSLKAAGLLSKILALPDNWNYSIKGLCAICKENETAVKSALNELRDRRYVIVERIEPSKETGGRIQYEYFVYEQPQGEENKKVDVKEAYKAKQEKVNQSIEKQGLENLGVDDLSVENQGDILNTNISSTNKSNTELPSTDGLSTDNKYAFSDKSSKENNIYASASEKQEEEQKPKKKSRYIPKDYTEEQLREHIKPVIDRYIDDNSYGLNKDELKNNLLEIITEFHREYEKKFGEKHRILADVSYENIAERFLNPPDILDTVYDVEAYSAMIEQYFIVEFNKRKKYKKPIEISLSHFMSDEIRGHLYWQTCV